MWLSYAGFEATPASLLGEEDQQDGVSEADRRQAAAEQEGPAAAAEREAHARRSVPNQCSQTYTCPSSHRYTATHARLSIHGL